MLAPETDLRFEVARARARAHAVSVSSSSPSERAPGHYFLPRGYIAHVRAQALLNSRVQTTIASDI